MKAIYLSMGNNQEDFEEVGLENIYMDQIRLLASTEITTYHPREWVQDVDKLLEQFQRFGITELFLGAYSHGQVACMEIAKAAPKYGITNIKMCLCDPVFRSKFLPRWKWIQFLSVRSIFSQPKITIPASVNEVWWVRQYVDLPRAHDLVAENASKTLIHPPIVLAHTHSRIQWSSRWFNLLVSKAKDFANTPPKAIPIQDPL